MGHPFFEAGVPSGRRTHSAPAAVRARGARWASNGRQAISAKNPISPGLSHWNFDTTVASMDTALKGKGYAFLHPRVPKKYQCFRSSDPDAEFPATFTPKAQYHDDHVHDYVPALHLHERLPRHCAVCGMKGQGDQRATILYACLECNVTVCKMCVAKPQAQVAAEVRTRRARSQPPTRFVTRLENADGTPFRGRSGSPRSASPSPRLRSPGASPRTLSQGFRPITAFGVTGGTSAGEQSFHLLDNSIISQVQSQSPPPQRAGSGIAFSTPLSDSAPSPIPSLPASHSPYPSRFKPGTRASHSFARSGPSSASLSGRVSLASYNTAQSSVYGVNSAVRIPEHKRERDFMVKYWDAVA